MADFCRDCTRELWHDVDAADLGAGWALCEGCGVHLFNGNGQRVCGLPTPDEADVTSEPCPACAQPARRRESTTFTTRREPPM